MKRTILAFSLAMLTVGAFAQKGAKSNDDFFKRNPNAKSVHWKKDNRLVLVLKSGKEEVYNLNDETQRAAVIAKYGSLPVAPPPPPVVTKIIVNGQSAPPLQAPLPPPPPVEVTKFTPPVILKDEVKPPPPPPAPPKVKKKRTYA